jgi:hypothetical protein
VISDVETTMIVLIDADDVKFAFSGWPDHICLAACLSSFGTCSMIVFRRDERHLMPDRLVKLLKLRRENTCFVPEVDGFKTKQFLYSDERRLMALVASDPVVLEEAVDYAVNYNYALEEGLDPAKMLGLDIPTADPVVASPRGTMVNEEANPMLPEFLRRSVERSRRPIFASRRVPTLGELIRA